MFFLSLYSFLVDPSVYELVVEQSSIFGLPNLTENKTT